MKIKTEAKEIWAEFESAKNFKNAIDLYGTVDKNESFYIGEQWRGVNAPDLDKPVMNILSRVVKFFISSIVSDDIGVSINQFDEDEAAKPVLDMVSAQFDEIMELTQYKKKTREVIRNAAVDGDGCMHFYFDVENDENAALHVTPGRIEGEIIENTDIHFGNPQSADVQRQPYILLNYRRMAQEVRETAQENGCDAEAIMPDENPQKHGDAPEEGKVTVVRKYWKARAKGSEEGAKTVWFCEVCAGGMVRGVTDTGYTRYPIAFFPWEKVKNQFHGQAAITGLIPNQIFINKLFAMSMQHIKLMAFPKVIYNRTLMPGGWNNRVGEAIPVLGDPNVAIAANYKPLDMSNQVLEMIDKVIQYTRDTMGASDASLGNVTPDNTSAIIATQKAAAMPLELQKQDFYCFVEDSVRVWLDMMGVNYGVRAVRIRQEAEIMGATAFAPDAMPPMPEEMPMPEDGAMDAMQMPPLPDGTQSGMMAQAMPSDAAKPVYTTMSFDFAALREMNLRLNVDIGAATYWSELMQVQTLDNLLTQGILTDAETYLENMPSGYVPGRQALIESLRRTKQEQQAQAQALEMIKAAPAMGDAAGMGVM